MSRLLLIAVLSSMLIACAGERTRPGPVATRGGDWAVQDRATLTTQMAPWAAVDAIVDAFHEMQLKGADGDSDLPIRSYDGDALSGWIRAKTSTQANIHVVARAMGEGQTLLTVRSDLPDGPMALLLTRIREAVHGTSPPQE